MLRSVFSGGLALALAVGVVHAQSGSPSPADLLKDPAVKAAIDAAKASEAQTIADQIRFCEIPAPEFKEEVRGQELKRVFTQLGPAERPRRQGRQRARRLSRRGRRVRTSCWRRISTRCSPKAPT